MQTVTTIGFDIAKSVCHHRKTAIDHQRGADE